MKQDNIIVLRVFNDIVEATMAQDNLKEAGLTAFVADENPIGLNPLGGIELKIFEKDLEAAERILAAGTIDSK